MSEQTEYRDLLRQSWRARHGETSPRRARLAEGEALLPARLESPPVVLGPRQRLRRSVYEAFLRRIESRGRSTLTEQETRDSIAVVIEDLSSQGTALSEAERARLQEEVSWEIRGLGPLGRLLIDPTISDVLVNGPHEIWVDRFGRLELTQAQFDDEEHLMRQLRRIASSHGRHIDEASPYVDVRMNDGSRLNAVIPPISSTPVISIRRMRTTSFQLEDLCSFGTLTQEMADFLTVAIRGGLNMLISGGTASGKTTLLNVLGGFIPLHERVVTIEETVELHFEHPHVVSLEARMPNIEGRGEVNLRALVRNALRMRPDRIIVGEVRGAEVFDMLQAMNTGHEGSLTTVHANSPEDALRRLESLVLMEGFELPSRAIRELLGAAFHLIVHVARFADGARRITSIGEVAAEPDRVVVRELYRFVRQPSRDGIQISGQHVATGTEPGFRAYLEDRGYPLAGLRGAGPSDDSSGPDGR